VTERVWRIDDAHRFHVFECSLYPVEYCLVSGQHPDQVLSQISVHLQFLDVDDLCNAFDRATAAEDKAIVTYALGLSSDDAVDPAIYERLVSALSDPISAVRVAAIHAAFVTGWRVFRDQLKRLSELDPDTQVAQLAKTVFTQLDSARVN
jgi:hypothetical protein